MHLIPMFVFSPLFRGDAGSFAAFEDMTRQGQAGLEIWHHLACSWCWLPLTQLCWTDPFFWDLFFLLFFFFFPELGIFQWCWW